MLDPDRPKEGILDRIMVFGASVSLLAVVVIAVVYGIQQLL